MSANHSKVIPDLIPLSEMQHSSFSANVDLGQSQENRRLLGMGFYFIVRGDPLLEVLAILRISAEK